MTSRCYGWGYWGIFLMSLFDVSQHIGYFKQIFKNLLRGPSDPSPPRLSQKPKFVLFFWKASLRTCMRQAQKYQKEFVSDVFENVSSPDNLMDL